VPDDHSARNRLILVLVSLLCGYVGAAAVSALVGGAAWLMLLPVVALAATSWWSGPSPAAAPTG
jgi:hypothetical protein